MCQDESLGTVDAELLPLLAERLRALGDPARLRLLQVLSARERTVGELVAETGYSQPNVSRHLDRLEQAGWVERRREGTRCYVGLADEVAGCLCKQLCTLIRRQAASAAERAGVGRRGDES